MLSNLEMKKGEFTMSRKLIITAAVLTIIFTCLIFNTTYADGENLIKNPGFEEAAGDAANGWYTDQFDKADDTVKFEVVEGNAHSGNKCFAITNIKDNDSKIIQDITVQAGKVYKISYWVKTEGIVNKAGSANISILNGIYTSPETFDTNGEWQKNEVYIKPDKDDLKFALRLGGYGSLNAGKVFFDDVTMELIENPEPGIKVSEFLSLTGDGSTNNDANKDGASSSSLNKVLLYVLIGIVVVSLLVFLEMKFAKRNKKSNEAEEMDEYTENDENDETDSAKSDESTQDDEDNN